jgi:hypothetical protein
MGPTRTITESVRGHVQVDASSSGKARALIDELGIGADEQWSFEIHVASPLVKGASTSHTD